MNSHLQSLYNSFHPHTDGSQSHTHLHLHTWRKHNDYRLAALSRTSYSILSTLDSIRVDVYVCHDYNRGLLLHCNVVVPCIVRDVVNPGLLQEQEHSESIGSPSAEQRAGMGELEVRAQSVSLESSEHSKINGHAL